MYKYLLPIMLLPLLDGLFITIILNDGLNSISDAIIVGLFILSGGANASIIITKIPYNLKNLKQIVQILIVLYILAFFQALFAPTINLFINTNILMYGAIIALLILAYNITPISNNYKILNPSIFIIITLLFSINYPAEIYFNINTEIAFYALISCTIASFITLLIFKFKKLIILHLNLNIIEYSTSIGLLFIILDILDIISSKYAIVIFITGFFVSWFISN